MSPEFLRRWSLVAALAGAGVVAGCGGGNSASSVPTPPPPPPPQGARGDLQSAVVVGTFTRAELRNQTAIDPSLVPDDPVCDVQLVSLRYVTLDPLGNKATAGAALLVPDEAGCPGPHPLLSHQHGTSVDKTFDTASSQSDSLAAMMGTLYASHGYVVVLPNYLGYAGSSVDWHAYLQITASATPVVDAMRAARHYMADHVAGSPLSGDVYLSGTSEGGYVTLATQYVVERDLASEFRLKAVSPTSGPYDVASTFLSYLQQPDTPDDPNTTPAAFTLYGYERTYRDLYGASPSLVFNDFWAPEFAVNAPVLLPGPYTGETALRNQCKLPVYVKDLGGPVVTPGCPTTPLLQAGFVADYVNDTPGTVGARARAHAADNALVVTGPTSAQRWTPQAPVYFCYGELDPMAKPNAIAADALANSTVENVQFPSGSNPLPNPSYVYQWMTAQANGPLPYHGQVEGPGCTSWTRNVVFPIPH